jgi:transcriptional antiterminator RfaH
MISGPFFLDTCFVRANSELGPWTKINSTIGVSKLVSFNGNPKLLPPQLIAGLMLRFYASGTFLPQKSLSKGDCMELLTGAFAKFIATVETIDQKQLIWVLMDFMGKKNTHATH